MIRVWKLYISKLIHGNFRNDGPNGFACIYICLTRLQCAFEGDAEKNKAISKCRACTYVQGDFFFFLSRSSDRDLPMVLNELSFRCRSCSAQKPNVHRPFTTLSKRKHLITVTHTFFFPARLSRIELISDIPYCLKPLLEHLITHISGFSCSSAETVRNTVR